MQPAVLAVLAEETLLCCLLDCIIQRVKGIVRVVGQMKGSFLSACSRNTCFYADVRITKRLKLW